MGTIEESSSILPQEVANAPLTRTATTKELGRKKRILIIDDETDITLTYKVALESEGFEVDVSNDPLETLLNFQAGGSSPGFYDLLLIDITMPKMNGFELYEKIKKIDNKVKVCYMSAYIAKVNYEALREKLPMLTMDNFIKKPIEIHDLVKRVKTELLF
jgi:DNA-binding response OmpR family regulator